MLKRILRFRSALVFMFGLSLFCLGAFSRADNQGDHQNNQGDNHQGDRYRYHDGHWHGQGDVVVSDIPVGGVVDSLPPQYSTVLVANNHYYYDNTRYYSQSPDGSYVVVVAPQNR